MSIDTIIYLMSMRLSLKIKESRRAQNLSYSYGYSKARAMKSSLFMYTMLQRVELLAENSLGMPPKKLS